MLKGRTRSCSSNVSGGSFCLQAYTSISTLGVVRAGLAREAPLTRCRSHLLGVYVGKSGSCTPRPGRTHASNSPQLEALKAAFPRDSRMLFPWHESCTCSVPRLSPTHANLLQVDQTHVLNTFRSQCILSVLHIYCTFRHHLEPWRLHYIGITNTKKVPAVTT